MAAAVVGVVGVTGGAVVVEAAVVAVVAVELLVDVAAEVDELDVEGDPDGGVLADGVVDDGSDQSVTGLAPLVVPDAEGAKVRTTRTPASTAATAAMARARAEAGTRGENGSTEP